MPSCPRRCGSPSPTRRIPTTRAAWRRVRSGWSGRRSAAAARQGGARAGGAAEAADAADATDGAAPRHGDGARAEPGAVRQMGTFLRRITDSLFAPARKLLQTGRPGGGLLDCVNPDKQLPWCIDFLAMVGGSPMPSVASARGVARMSTGRCCPASPRPSGPPGALRPVQHPQALEQPRRRRDGQTRRRDRAAVPAARRAQRRAA